MLIKRGPRIGLPQHGGVPSGSFLKRTITWSVEGFSWRHDPAHVETIVKACLGDRRPAERNISPGSKHVGKAAKDAADPLEHAQMKEFQRLAATALYLAGDRFEIQNAVTHLMRGMCNPLQLHWLQLCRLAAYLHAHPSYEILFKYQEMPNLVYAEVDSDWAGCLETRRSTDGGYEFFGTSLLDGWANTQQSIALSSGEAELYGVCNGAARVLWTKNLLDDCGFTVNASVGTDSTAAKGITARLGTGKVRHLETRCLWIQERVRSKEISILKVPTEKNRGDMQTKPLDPTRFWMLMAMLPIRRTTTGCSSVSVAMIAITMVASVGSVEANGKLATTMRTMPEDGTWSSLELWAVCSTLVLYTIAVVSATAMLTRWYTTTAPRRTRGQVVGTDKVRLVAYWDLDLAVLRGIAEARGFLGGRNVTKKFLVAWLLEGDYTWLLIQPLA